MDDAEYRSDRHMKGTPISLFKEPLVRTNTINKLLQAELLDTLAKQDAWLQLQVFGRIHPNLLQYQSHVWTRRRLTLL